MNRLSTSLAVIPLLIMAACTPAEVKPGNGEAQPAAQVKQHWVSLPCEPASDLPLPPDELGSLKFHMESEARLGKRLVNRVGGPAVAGRRARLADEWGDRTLCCVAVANGWQVIELKISDRLAAAYLLPKAASGYHFWQLRALWVGEIGNTPHEISPDYRPDPPQQWGFGGGSQGREPDEQPIEIHLVINDAQYWNTTTELRGAYSRSAEVRSDAGEGQSQLSPHKESLRLHETWFGSRDAWLRYGSRDPEYITDISERGPTMLDWSTIPCPVELLPDAERAKVAADTWAKLQALPKDDEHQAEGIELLRMAARAGHPTAMLYLAGAYKSGAIQDHDDAAYKGWLVQAAEAGEPRAQVTYGRTLWKSNAARAVELFERAAEAGEASAHAELGRAYEYGAGGKPKDMAQAIAIWQRGYEMGNSACAYYLGNAFADGKGVDADPVAAAEYWRVGAERGSMTSAVNYGIALYDGNGVERNVPLGNEYMLRAADAGIVEAMHNIAWSARNGRGMPVSYELAAAWYAKAADAGWDLSIWQYGVMMLKDQALETEEHTIESLMGQASQIGFKENLFNLGCEFRDGNGDIKQDRLKALKCFEIAADYGEHPGAAVEIGRAYDNGWGVAVNKKLALERYEWAAERGSDAGRHNAGWMYYIGDSVERDWQKAFTYFKQGADNDYSLCRTKAGIMGILGQTQEISIEQSLTYLSKSHAVGDVDASAYLYAAYALGLESNGEWLLERDAEKAKPYMQVALDSNHPFAQFARAEELLQHHKDDPDARPEALRLLKLAAPRMPAAKRKLEKLEAEDKAKAAEAAQPEKPEEKPAGEPEEKPAGE